MDVLKTLGLKAAPRVVERPLRNNVSAFDYSAEVRRATAWALSLPPSDVWDTQPYVRTVVTFLARNIAQLGLHTFQRVDDTRRERVRDNRVAKMLARPNATTTSFELLFALVCDKALYDRAYWIIGSDDSGRDTITRVPPARVLRHNAVDPLSPVESFHITDGSGRGVDVPADRILYFPGWNPVSANALPSSPLEAIKSVIAEQAAAFEFRKLAWANGLQGTGTIERPAGMQWKDGARDRFIADVRSQFGGDGPRRGSFLLLEDGMKLNSQQFNAREAEWIEAAKLSLALVASIYHVNPTMVGLLDNANYSNVREFRKMLYGDTLGPIMASIEDRLNAFLVPRFDDSGELYVEFNIAEKLQGSFEEQAAALQTSVGGPWMLRSEARARLNMPPVDGADELIVPLNVVAGGQASPTDSAPPASAASEASQSALVLPHRERSEPREHSNVVSLRERVDDALADVLTGFYARQSRAVLSRLGAKRADWWDAERWDRELTDELLPMSASSDVATAFARWINAGTKRQLDDALATSSDPASVFDRRSAHIEIRSS